MANFKYVMRVLSGVKLKKYFNVLDRIQKRSGKNKIFLFFDTINCAVRYGAGYYDYLIFGFHDMNSRQRKTYLTRMKNRKAIAYLNNAEYTYIFNEKNVFNKRFINYLKRDFLDVAEMNLESFKEFAKDKKVIFAKPNSSESGKGIERLLVENFASLDDMYAYITDKSKNFGVLEQEIIQHPEMARLYPLAVNTIRIVTVVGNDGTDAHCAYATCKMGNEGKFVDNMENSGLACPIDRSTGRICGVAHTSALINYEKHPYTGIELVGYEVPFAKEAVDLCLKAALEVPEMRYIGWDVCITPDGPAIIEGNNYPGYDFWQLPEHTPDKIGLLPFLQQFVPGL
ncbi:MAG: carboxylate--amine ligase [Clostridiales bacterium]|nr:carboxylate--amine ligase [Clostridiales bacterium]